MKSLLYTLNVSPSIKANAVFLTQNASLNLRLMLPLKVCQAAAGSQLIVN